MVNSFAADFARVATLQFTNSVGGARMRWLGRQRRPSRALAQAGQRQEVAGEADQDQQVVLRAAGLPGQAAGRDARAGRRRQPARQHADRLDQRAGQGQLAHARQHPLRAGRQRPGLQDGPLAQVPEAAAQPAAAVAGPRHGPPDRALRQPRLLRRRRPAGPDLTAMPHVKELPMNAARRTPPRSRPCSARPWRSRRPSASAMRRRRRPRPRAFVDGTGPGWRALGEADFVNVNCDPDTWTWKDGVVHCTGKPVGVTRTSKPVHQLRAGRPVAAPPARAGTRASSCGRRETALEGLKPGTLPHGGIEVQMLDHGYAEQYEKKTGKKADWFTTNGDVFPVGTSKMTPFPPTRPTAAQLPAEEPEQGRRRVEPLLRPRHQRRGPALGQRRGSLRRQRLRAAHGLSLPRIRRVAGRVPGVLDSRAAVVGGSGRN